MDSNSYQTPRHPIGVASRRTGLKPDLIRAWERRYDAVVAARTVGGHRLYSDADIERLVLLDRVVSAGRNIGQVARLSQQDLEELCADDRAAAEPRSGSSVAADETAAPFLSHCMEAVRQLDPRRFETELERASVALSRLHLIEQVLVPLMDRIGDSWNAGELGAAHEHMAAEVVRSFVGGIRGAYQSRAGAPRLLCTTPPGQRHELGALVIAACAAAEGWHTTYLGADLPVEEIAAAARQTRARAVALSITFPTDDPLLAPELEKLERLLPSGVELLVGGRAAAAYGQVLDRLSARSVSSVAELRRELDHLRSRPAIASSGEPEDLTTAGVTP